AMAESCTVPDGRRRGLRVRGASVMRWPHGLDGLLPAARRGPDRCRVLGLVHPSGVESETPLLGGPPPAVPRRDDARGVGPHHRSRIPPVLAARLRIARSRPCGRGALPPSAAGTIPAAPGPAIARRLGR